MFIGDVVTFQTALPDDPEHNLEYPIEIFGTAGDGQNIYASGAASARTRWVSYWIRDPLWSGRASDLRADWTLEAFLQ